MATFCGWCEQLITLNDPQTHSLAGSWHTRCWNEAEAERREMEESLPDEGPDDPRPETKWSEELIMATNQRQLREQIEFPPNIPVTVALRYSEGKIVSGAYGERCMYSTTDNRIFFVDPPVAQQIVELGVNVREPFTITRRVSGRKDEPATWEVSRPVGEQSDGTFVVPAPPPPAAIAPKPPATATSSSGSLVNEANALVDAFAEVLARALEKHQGRVKPDEVRSILLSAYIQRGKYSGAA